MTLNQKCNCWMDSVYSEPLETCNKCNGTGQYVVDVIQPKDEYLCDNCFEMQADYGAPGLDGTTVWICSACQEEGTYENVEFEGDYE